MLDSPFNTAFTGFSSPFGRLMTSIAAFNPTTLFTGTDTGWFYDHSDMSTLFQDAAGTTPVTAVGQPVGLQLDKSGKGNHRTQSTALNRPTLARHPVSGIRNALTRTEEFDDAVWQKSGATATAATITTTSTISRVFQNAILVSAATYAFSVKLRAGTSTRAAIRAVGYDTQPGAWFNLSSGTVETVSSGMTAAIDPVDPEGFYRCSVTFSTVTALSGSFNIYPTESDGNFGTTAGRTLDAKEAQLELGSTATAYQRVTTQFDVTEAGVPDAYYLNYDGINDSMATASFAWGTDKATVVAGVRKLSDAAGARTIVETSANSDSTNGTFRLGTDAATFTWRSRGTVSADTSGAGVQPITTVLTGIGDIAGDVARLRQNAAQVGEVLTDQGTGNYGTYQTFFGARAGTSVFFNGREYSQFAINRLLTEGELSDIEAYTAGRTGVAYSEVTWDSTTDTYTQQEVFL
jgi:hypothetical protein